MSELLTLAQRVEGAEGPDRPLDAAIAELLGPSGVRWSHERGDWMMGVNTDRCDLVPLYTASIDAAMTLVPEEHSFDLSKDHHNQGGKWLCIVGPDEGYHQTGHANAATPALAIVAAALRARASMETTYE